MNRRPPLLLFLFLLLLLLHLIFLPRSDSSAACSTKCGSLDVRYPFGTGFGCGAPNFFPAVTCDGDSDSNRQLTLNTHVGKYPITSISYSASTVTVMPPLMSTCATMHPAGSPAFGLDWSAPFQIAPAASVFVLLACASPLAVGPPLCDPAAGPRLCSSLLACPAVAAIGLPLYAPTNTCCVYSPAGLGPKGDLDIQRLGCSSYASVKSTGPWSQTDASTWEYGVVLQYGEAGTSVAEDVVTAEACSACEGSGGACGYAPPKDYFVCVCDSGLNTSTDCYGLSADELKNFWSTSTATATATNHPTWTITSSRGILLWMLMLLGVDAVLKRGS
ncbi:uncharacterized protein LOC121994138 [Zingiber officinale]|uniref:uncharacterized protein LOC121994138 n=1 Tax=Zingiber officinale TaxID=94328 RepID=UPI001C4C2C1B|nr:uncharacterized protein LOC121994138 [Zingiber officinale]